MRYNIYGDAVNTASRMESTGVAGEVHTSEAFVWQLTATDGLSLERRGQRAVKGKGLMTTYFVRRAVFGGAALTEETASGLATSRGTGVDQDWKAQSVVCRQRSFSSDASSPHPTSMLSKGNGSSRRRGSLAPRASAVQRPCRPRNSLVPRSTPAARSASSVQGAAMTLTPVKEDTRTSRNSSPLALRSSRCDAKKVVCDHLPAEDVEDSVRAAVCRARSPGAARGLNNSRRSLPHAPAERRVSAKSPE